jgi:hypothetical protein
VISKDEHVPLISESVGVGVRDPVGASRGQCFDFAVRPTLRFRRHKGFDFAVCDDKSISRVRPSGSGAAALAISLQAIFKAFRLQPVTRDHTG